MSVHDGHRERLRRRFLDHGLQSFNEIEALELLLFYALAQKDTNPLAHALLDRFGSLDEVLHASVQELCSVPGIGEKTAALLTLVPELNRLGELSRVRRTVSLRTTEEMAAYLGPYFSGLQEERLLMVCLDSAMRVISTEELSRGVVNGVRFDVRRLVELALRRKASYVLLAHNHPDGQAVPSREDDETTRDVCRALHTIEIPLFDHLIFAGDRFVSYRRSGALDILRYQMQR